MADNSDKAREFFSEFRVSRGLSPVRLILLSVAIGFCIGFVALGPQITGATPARIMLSYILAGLMAGFTVWTALDMQRAAPEPHGVYRLALQAQADWLSSLEGWLLLGGELALVALLGRTFADHVLSLFSGPPTWAHPAAAAGIVLLMALPNLLGKGQRRLQTIILILPLAAYWIFLVAGKITGVAATAAATVGTQVSGWASSALALAGFWGLEAALVESEDLQRPHANLPRILLATAALIPATAGLAALVVPKSGATLVSWTFWTQWGSEITTTAVCVLLAGALWWALLILGRQGIALSRHGFLPAAFSRLNARLRTPLAFQAAGTGAALAMVLLIPRDALSSLTSFVWGMVAVGLNTAAILRYYRNERAKRKTSLPFFPMVPGLGIAGALFLMAFLPGRAWLAGILWAGAGLAIYALFGVRWRAQKREGITIFREKDEERPRSAFRVLVPVANPRTAKHLMELALGLAKPVGGDIVALQVIETPAQVSIASGRRLARGQLEALKAASDAVEEQGVPVHAMTRVARSAHQGILDTAVEEACDLIILGWTQRTRAVPGSLGRILDNILRDAPCSVLIISGELPQRVQSIVVPVTSGPHSEKALQLAGQLAQSAGACVKALHVLPTETHADAESETRERMAEALEPLAPSCDTEARVVRSDDVVRAIVKEAESADLIIMGTSKESWLDRVLFGIVPEQVLARTKNPLILTKAHTGIARAWLHRLWDSIYGLFPNLESDETMTLYRSLREGAQGNVNYYVLIVLSAIIASLGLLANSAAVIIGAMLVAPLMTPILALSLGIVLGEPRMLSRGVESTIKGVGASIVISAFSALLFPVPQLTAEIMARTHPTLLDLAVALASGAAGAYALARKEVAAALPGVAIAAALMPPVCTVGIGLASGSGVVMGGSLLLFVTNLTAITLAGALTFLLLGIRPAARAEQRQAWLRRGLRLAALLLVAISILLAGIMFQAGRTSGRHETIQKVLAAQVQKIGEGRLISLDVAEREGGEWRIEATVQAPSLPADDQVEAVSGALADALGQPVKLKLCIVLTEEVEGISSPAGTNR